MNKETELDRLRNEEATRKHKRDQEERAFQDAVRFESKLKETENELIRMKESWKIERLTLKVSHSFQIRNKTLFQAALSDADKEMKQQKKQLQNQAEKQINELRSQLEHQTDLYESQQKRLKEQMKCLAEDLESTRAEREAEALQLRVKYRQRGLECVFRSIFKGLWLKMRIIKCYVLRCRNN